MPENKTPGSSSPRPSNEAVPAPPARDGGESSPREKELSEFAHGLKPASHAQFMGMLNWNPYVVKARG
jgi:hypothetical protein